MQAQFLVLSSEYDLHAIADATGYCDGPALHHAFVSQLAVTPTEFRKAHFRKYFK